MIILWVLLGLICYFGVIYLHLLIAKYWCFKSGRKSTVENIFDEIGEIAFVMFIPVSQVLSLIIMSIRVFYKKFKDFEL